MKRFSRLFLFGSLILILITAACAANQTGTPTLVGSTLPPLNTSTPLGGTGVTLAAETATLSVGQNASTSAAGGSQNPGIPVTGLDIVTVVCQFCIDNVATALLVLPDTATFQVVSSDPAITETTGTTVKTNCATIEVNNGKRVVLCSGLEKTPITLNICTNATTCTTVPVQLQACSLNPVSTTVPDTPTP